MSVRRLPTWLALPVVAVLVAVVTVVFSWPGAGTSPERSQSLEPGAEIDAHATTAPRPVLFGDTVRVSVGVLVDAGRIQPESVRVAADFTPWEVVGKPRRRIQSAGDEVYVSTAFVLRCLTGTCIPSGHFSDFTFDPGLVTFVRQGALSSDEQSIPVTLPPVRVYTRLADAPTGQRSAPWQADVLSLPAPSFRISPDVLVVTLLLLALVATAGGVALAYVAWPRREPLVFEPEPWTPPPLPAPSPLEQALLLLEQAVRVNGAADQRRALELVAEELEGSDWGDTALAGRARALAWSEGSPPVDQTAELAARVRGVLEGSQNGSSDGGGDGA
jgi:hypothetical protein